jgi:hypothetical protein
MELTTSLSRMASPSTSGLVARSAALAGSDKAVLEIGDNDGDRLAQVAD